MLRVHACGAHFSIGLYRASTRRRRYFTSGLSTPRDRPPLKPLTHVRDIVVLAFRPLNRAFGDQDDFWHPPNLGDLGQAGPA